MFTTISTKLCDDIVPQDTKQLYIHQKLVNY